MRARAFSLLELTLATAIGAIVLAVALSMFAVSSRADRRQEGRFIQDAELARLHRAVTDALTTIVVGEIPPNLPGTGGAAPVPSPNVSGSSGASARIILEADSLAGAQATPSMTTGFPAASAVQRLELVLARPPVRDLVNPIVSVSAPVARGGGVRGVFELRPEFDPRTGASRVDARGRRVFTLSWREIPKPPGEGEEAPPAPRPIPISGGIVYLRWEFFHDEKKLEKYAALNVLDLPAYVTLQVETERGLSVDWLFEVGWTSGRDPHEPPPEPEATGDLLGGAALQPLRSSGVRLQPNQLPARPAIPAPRPTPGRSDR